jgi:hypothetical protein
MYDLLMYDLSRDRHVAWDLFAKVLCQLMPLFDFPDDPPLYLSFFSPYF